LAQEEGGSVKLIGTGGEDFGWTSEELANGNMADAEIVAIPWGGNPSVKYYKGSFVTADNRIATSLDNSILATKYLYYALQSRIEELASFYRGAGIKHPNMSKVLDMRIPVPPIEVQFEIVRILDHFKDLEGELDAELQARRKQFDYYRNELLTFDPTTPRRPLGEIAKIGTGRHDTQDAVESGEYIFYARGREPLRLDTYDYDEQAIITAGDGAGVGKVFHFAEGRYSLHQRAYRIVPNSNVSAKFLFHYMVSDFEKYLEKISVHASVTSLRLPMFLKYAIPMPDFSEQERIANILDTFDALVNDIHVGLPAEISTRRRQYNYYLNRLLTLPEVAA
jgi:type I restriction enzyme S subunit